MTKEEAIQQTLEDIAIEYLVRTKRSLTNSLELVKRDNIDEPALVEAATKDLEVINERLRAIEEAKPPNPRWTRMVRGWR